MLAGGKKYSDHPGFEPGTFSLLVKCSTNSASESDGGNIDFSSSVGIQFNPVPSIWL